MASADTTDTTETGSCDALGASCTTLGEMLVDRAQRAPERAPFVWLEDGDRETPIRYADLMNHARRIAARLTSSRATGRALLLYLPGPDFIYGFFGCQLAGFVAIPAYPPDPSRPKRFRDRLASIVRDADVTHVLCTEGTLPVLQEAIAGMAEFDHVEWVATDALPTELGQGSESIGGAPEDVAVIQYTSGSTSDPKGVVLDHRNILSNSELIHRCFQTGPGHEVVLWLPPYHDMGLFGGIVQTVYADMRVRLMSPLDFLRCPLRWLEAISRSGGTLSGGPNFAYDLAVRKSTPEQRAELDLSSWRIAFNGAEPVRVDTMEAFAKAFAPSGFDPKAFFPVYGLAEVTLLAAAPSVDEAMRSLVVCRRNLNRHKVVPVDGLHREAGKVGQIVGCGSVIPEHRLEIVDPDTRSPRAPGEVGEIWMQGPSIARGYHGKPEATRETFEATLEDGSGPFLRTGDLGSIVDGSLYVTGRSKDVLIVRGRNFYPQDVERIAESATPRLRQGCTACFQLDGESVGDGVVLVAEVAESHADAEAMAIFQEVSSAVRERLDLQIDLIVLVEARSVPKTSSGKLQRRACRDALVDDALPILARWSHGVITHVGPLRELGAADDGRSAREIELWLVDRIASVTGLPASSIDPNQDLAHFGLDSVAVVDLISELEVWLGHELPDEILGLPDVTSLAQAIVDPEGAGVSLGEGSGVDVSPTLPTPLIRAAASGADLREACDTTEHFTARSGVSRERCDAEPPRLHDSVIGGEARWREPYDWEHASPLRFLNTRGRDLFGRTTGYAELCRQIKRDQVWSFELNRIALGEGGFILVETRDGERHWAVDLASHDYLGITHHRDVVAATRRAIEEYGVGASGATMLNGNTPIHRALEAELADFLGKEAVALGPSGFGMMSAVTSGLLRPSDVVFFDHYSHTSLLDGITLSGARSIRYPHNDVEALERLLVRYRDEGRGAMIVTDGVCSIDGSLAPVAELVALARRHEARLVIDDAHGIGALNGGRGLTAGHDVDLVGGVLSKALGSCGGFVAGERRVVEYLRFFGHSACATTNVSVANAAAALEALRILRAHPERVVELEDRVKMLREALANEGVRTENSAAPIVSILIGRDADSYRAWRALLELGVLAQALPFPIVPRNQARIRARVSHKLDPELIPRVASALAKGTAEIRGRARALVTPSVRRPTLRGFETTTLGNGVRAHVRPGRGPWRVFLHPLLFGAEEIYADVLARHDGPHGIVALDWWGHGDAGPAPASGLSLDDMAETLPSLLSEAGVAGACRVVGTSMGAMLGMRFAGQHPEWVLSTLLIGGSADAEEGPARRFFEAMLDIASALGSESVVDDVLTSQFSSEFRGQRPEVVQSFLELLRERDAAAAAPCIQAVLSRSSASDQLAGIAAPCVVMVGEEDLAEPIGHSERMAEQMPSARLEIVPRCGHLVPVERPDVLLTVLSEWDVLDAG